MKESDNNTEEPLIDKENKQANVEVLDNPKENKDKPIEQLEVGKEDESEEESNKLLQDKITSTKKKMMKFQQMNLKELIAQQMKDILMILIWNQIFLTDLFFIGLLQF
jgi:hypothetical protein